MKRFVAIAMTLVMSLSLVACGNGEDKYLGKYICEAIETEGMVISPETFEIDAYLKLEEDGEGVFNFEEKTDIEWEIDEDTIILSAEGEELEGEIEDGVIELEVEDMTMWFVGPDGELPTKIQKKLEDSDMSDLFGSLGTDTEDEDGGDKAVDIDPEETVTEAGDFEPVSAVLGDYEVTVVGAEMFEDVDGKSAIRFYYDFTNNSDETSSAYAELGIEVEQDGYPVDTTYASYNDDVEEVNHASLNVRPGVTIRCVGEYFMKEDGGTVVVNICDYWDESGLLTVEFDPANLPGVVGAPYEIEPITAPSWTDELSDECTLEDGSYVYIDAAEVDTDSEGNEILRVFFDYTNGSEDAQSLWFAANIYAYQDGIELEKSYWTDVDTDEMYSEDVNSGESAYASISFIMRSDSPVEIEVSDYDGAAAGCYFELE